jgi:hypothetical protein
MRWFGLATLCLLAAACGSTDDGAGTDDGPPIPRGRPGECGNTAPIIQSLTANATDPAFYETTQGRQCLSTVTITVQPYDEDGDLDYYIMDLWWDEVVDGRVLAEGPFQRIEGTIAGTRCEVFSVQGINMRLGIGGNPPFQTEVEFGVVIEDSSGNRSNGGVPQVVSLVTPGQAGPNDCN